MTSPQREPGANRKRKASDSRASPNQKRRPSPSTRSPIQKRHRKSPTPPREPTPPPPSPPRKTKRPGGAARISHKEAEEAKRAKEARDAAIQAESHRAGVQNVVTQHYNAVPERGREWRKTDSKIKGLRSYNNWVKSVLIRKCTPSGHRDVKVLDIGCGKGGDLQKWSNQPDVDLYVGLDPAEVSIKQARDRYQEMRRRQRRRLFHGEFITRDCFDKSLGDVPIIRNVGFDNDPKGRWTEGGFDCVSMMFCMHYAFENQEKCQIMLANVAGALKKGGKFIGVIPNSDIISAKVVEHYGKQASANNPQQAVSDDDDDDDWDPEKSLDVPDEKPPEKEQADASLEWGNSIFRVKFPGKIPEDGVFRPPYGWKYFYFLEEAVEEVPEYVVPWEAFRGMAEDFNLELEYRKPFNEVWDEEGDHPHHGPLSERMGVRGRDRGPLLVTREEMEAASFYHAFCFYKT